MSVDGSAGVCNRHVNCTNEGLNKVISVDSQFGCWVGWHHKSSLFRENVINASV